MKKFLFLFSLFFVNSTFCVKGSIIGSLIVRDSEDRNIVVENNSKQTISIAYRDANCLMSETIKPHHRLILISSTPFLCIQQEKFFLQNKRHHFVIEASKINSANALQIFDSSPFFALK